ncbi:MAG: chromate transporter [Candidatus Protistobacter heckmanni]|nr:chromate transporter [Candidatus Protistobacter heckmanni]
MSTWDILLDLCTHFSTLSLLAFGGVSAIIPEMHRYLVDSMHYLTGEQFATYYSISAAAPGPNMLYVALFGWQAAGVFGTIASTLAICGPSSLLALAFAAAADKGDHQAEKRSVRIVRKGLAPLSVGLVLSTGWVLLLQFDGAFPHPWKSALLSAATLAALLHTKIHPLWMISFGALLG